MPMFAGSAFGWGCQGHQIIALIARAHLTPAASAAVDKLLSENPIDPSLSRFCRVHPADLMADSATWADDARNGLKNGAWHYVDIPLTVQEGNAMEWCPPILPAEPGKDRTGCILNALEMELGNLRDKAQAGPARAEALRYVIHFLGDLSQPLHTEDNHDQGGNCVTITPSYQDRTTNLHSLWDSGLIGNEAAQKKLTDAQMVTEIDNEFSPEWNAWSAGPVDLQAWAWDAHKVAVSMAYTDVTPHIPVAARDAGGVNDDVCTADKASTAGMHFSIGPDYAAEVLPVIHQQIAKAAYRIAGVLNSTFK
jgi:hypothetical protein